MIRINAHRAIAFAAALGLASAAQAVTVTVDPAAPWLGYMNVFELPQNGGNYVFGSPWGTQDLTATFAGNVLTLGPNTIGDPNPFWYTPEGGPGAQGNKIMEANMYVETTGVLSGNLTFAGTVLSNSLTSAHTAIAFIKDFAPDYSSFVQTTVPLTPGAFSISADLIPDPARHVQYGFQMTGVNVWVTDVAPFGTVTVTGTTPGLVGDFDNDGDRDAADIDALFDAPVGPVTPSTAKFDVNADNTVNTTVGVAGSDVDHWVRNLKATQYGDATLNGQVNFDDLLILAQNYNTTVGNPSWAIGNFNGDANVNFDDLLALAQNYNFGVSLMGEDALAQAGGSQFMTDLALARSLVPEPMSLSAVGGLALVAGRRRRA